jgi:hypothetical protein
MGDDGVVLAIELAWKHRVGVAGFLNSGSRAMVCLFASMGVGREELWIFYIA